MFNTDSIIKEVNIITKTISYLMIMIALVLVNEPLFIIFVNVFLIVITKQYPNILKINLISLGMNILNIFYPQFLWIKFFLYKKTINITVDSSLQDSCNNYIS